MLMPVSRVRSRTRARLISLLVAGALLDLAPTGPAPVEAAESCGGRSGSDLTVTASGTRSGLREVAPPDGHTFDLRATTFAGNQDSTSPDYNPTPVNLGTDTLPDAMCILGGHITGTHDRDLDWMYLKKNPGNGDRPAMRVGGNVTIDGLRVDNMMNGIRPFSDGMTLRNAYFDHIRDDCVANDSLHAMRIEDSLFDGCYTAFSARPEKSSPLWDAGPDPSVTEIDRVLVRLKPMAGGHNLNPDVSSYDHLFKWSNVAGPAVVRDSIIMVEQNGVNNHIGWPSNVTAHNVTIVWAGTGDYPGDVPPGATLTRDTTIWHDARTDWLTRHGCTDVHTCNPDQPTNPTTDTTDTSRRDDQVRRLAGVDRVGTAVKVSRHSFPQALTAIVASSRDFPDALAAAQLADAVEGPVLLTDPGSLDPRVASELDRLGVREVLIVGGRRAVSSQVNVTLRDHGYRTVRIGGASRYETAVAIATAALERRPTASPRTVLFATGVDFPDALAAGPLAGHADLPLILVDPSGQRAGEVVTAFLDSIGATHVTALGGVGVLPAPTLDHLADGRPTARIAGADRYATARRLVTAALGAGATLDGAFLTRGSDFPDALAASAAAVALGGVVALTGREHLSPPTHRLLAESVGWTSLNVVGGPQAVSAVVVRRARAATGL